MPGRRVVIVVIGVTFVVGAAVLGYVLSRVVGGEPALPAAAPAAAPPPVPAPGSLSPTPAPAPPPPAPASPAPKVREAAGGELRVTVEPLPTTVGRGAPLTVRWRIDGAPELRGTTRLRAELTGVPATTSPAAPVTALPGRFASVVRPAAPGVLTLTVEFLREGVSVTARQTLTVQ